MHRGFELSKIVQLGVVANLIFGCGNEGIDTSVENATIDLQSENANTKITECTTQRSRHAPAHAGLRAVTFNAGLAPGFEPLATERAPQIVSALKEIAADADLLCVQEFWQRTDFERLNASLTELPHVFRTPPRPGSGRCTESELLPLVGCLGSSCPDNAGEQMVGCAVAACPLEVTALSGGCLGCVMNHLDGLAECLTTESIRSDPAIFGGSYDIGLLSRWPVQQANHRELSSYFVRASVLHARLFVPQLGPVDAFCTHLGSPLGIVNYAGPFGTWEGEHQRQVQELIAFVREQNDGIRPMVLLGDLNMGPEVGHNTAVLPDQYAMLLAAGFENAYASKGNPLCTNCAGTTFRNAAQSNELIDHVLSARLSTHDAKSQRLFIEPVALGNDLPLFNLSDHFGLKVTFHRAR